MKPSPEDWAAQHLEDVPFDEPKKRGRAKPNNQDAGQRRNRTDNVKDSAQLDDFRAYMRKESAYIFAPTGELWPGSSVDSRVPPVCVGVGENGKPKFISASLWLAKNRPVEQMSWVPGAPQLIRDRLIIASGWIARPGATVFNQYRPPTIERGDPAKAGKCRDHLSLVYPDDAGHIVKFLAHRLQKPHEKINHGLFLGGPPGIGKDTVLAPVRQAVGPWNCDDIAPKEMFDSRFNGYRKSILLRISEAHDLGDVSRYQFYERLKTLCASPPETLRVDEKNTPEYYVPNVVAVVITSNHKTDGVYLPADDRRTYVAWSERKEGDFSADYWAKLWRWYEAEDGFAHVAAYLATLDIVGFDAKAPPPKTEAFWEIVNANRAPEDAELADVIDQLALKDQDGKPVAGSPVAFTLATVLAKAVALAPLDDRFEPKRNSFAHWLGDRKNRRSIRHRFELCGYAPVRNSYAKDGLWRINGARQTIYALAAHSLRDRLEAANIVVAGDGETVLELPAGR
jgi:hypothetical protein